MTDTSVKIVSQDDKVVKIAGYGVVFGGQDLEGEKFEPDTDFALDLVPTKPIMYDHALQPDVKHELGRTISTTIDEVGIWVEAQLDRSKRYVEQVLKLIEMGIIGFSSGTVGHLMAREGKTIKRWPIVEFSLTPTPAEPRTLGVERIKSLCQEFPELKALIPQESGEDSEGAGTENKTPIITILEDRKMSDITLSMDEYKELVRNGVKPEPAPEAVEDPAVKALAEKLDSLTKFIESSPRLKDAGYAAPDSELDHSEVKSLGDFLVAVKNGNDRRLKSIYKTALAEESGATGGYLVPVPLMSPIIAAAENFSVLRRAGATIVPMSTNSVEFPALDIETAPSAGDTSYAGGVVATWEGEASALDETEPRFRMVTLQAHKLSGYSLISNELAADAPAIEGLLTTMFGRAVGSKENYAFFRGDGVGKPLGILNSGALISGDRNTASNIKIDDLSLMMSDFLPSSWGKGVWFINPEAVEQLIQLVASPLSFQESLRNGMPMTLLGMPMYVTGALPAINTAGDILLVDPSYYLIGDRQQLSIAYSEHYKFANDQGTWRFTHRVDGQPWVKGAITLENASTVVSPFVALAAD